MKAAIFGNGVLALFLFVPVSVLSDNHDSPDPRTELIHATSTLFGLNFSDKEIERMLQGDIWDATDYNVIRNVPLDNSIPMTLEFNPLPRGFQLNTGEIPHRYSQPARTTVPATHEELAFYSVREMAHLLETRQITSTQLTQMYLKRLKTYGPMLECVISLTEERALQQAKQADEDIAAGNYKGLLHGIPYGVKDLFALEGTRTTWGAKPFEDQRIDDTATIIRKLDEAGAVLVAKLTLGALAMGDVWYGGVTKNPWNLDEGSSGSSAGSASATAAGLVAFAIGTETNGSIVSPSLRCGSTGLRPTFGRVSRAGGMTLSWSMDKVGPICRSAQDCAIVLDVIRGEDGIDTTVLDAGFSFVARKRLDGLRIGVPESAMADEYNNRDRDLQTLGVIESLGAELVPIEFPDMNYSALFVILSSEAAAAFDELTRSGRDDLLVRQNGWAWPNAFRKARLIPAVEYINANRIRSQLIHQMADIMGDVDAVVTPPFRGNSLLLTNLTGHPCITIPNGFEDDDTPTGINILGNLFDEQTILEVAHAYQQATSFHRKHPKLVVVEE